MKVGCPLSVFALGYEDLTTLSFGSIFYLQISI